MRSSVPPEMAAHKTATAVAVDYTWMWTILGCAAGQDTVFGLCP